MSLHSILHCTVIVAVIAFAVGKDTTVTEIKAPPLPGNFFIKKDQITLSGLSTGGAFGQTFHLSHSRLFSGIGTFSAFFWKCGDYSVSLEAFYATCGKPGGYDVQGNLPKPGADNPALAIKTARMYARQKKIDKLDNLAHQKIFIWQGTIDEFVTPNVGLSAINIYEPYLYSPEQIHTQIQYAHHHLPTYDKGTLCPIQSDPTVDSYLGNCQYNGAYHMLNWLIGSQNVPLQWPSGKPKIDNLMLFDQTEFMNSPNIGLANEGFIYVPTNCNPKLRKYVTLKPTCYLHFYFHGCFLTRDEVGTNHIKGSGFLQVAEKNNIIIVFPMALVTKFNSGGCFDSFGYTGVNYATKSGPQVKAVFRMLKRLLNIQRIDDEEDFQETGTNTPIHWISSTTSQSTRYPWPTYSWSLNYTRH